LKTGIRYILLLTTLFAVLSSCSTKKKSAKKQKTGFLSRAYHNTVARYNRLYNAKLIYGRAQQNINKDIHDDYTITLPVFKWTKPEAAESQKTDLETAIKKLSENISAHPFSKWVDDSYLLLGKSHLVKGEKANAAENFDYVATEYIPEKIALRFAKAKLKKGKNLSVLQEKSIVEKARKKKFKFPAHKPVHKEAQYWLALTRIADNNLREAQQIINRLKGDTTLLKKNKAMIWQTDAYIKALEYDDDAQIRSLEQALKFIKKKKEKGRVAFILAQLYEQKDSNNTAIKNYKKAIKSKPVYEMDLYARLNIMMLEAVGNDTLKIASSIKKLDKMLYDEKNIEYKDVIYYTMGNIYAKNNEMNVAYNYYNKALKNQGSNSSVKSAIYLKLANIYFDKQQYEKAYNYYDSTLLSINENHPKYNWVSKRKNNINDIISKIRIIEEQDSLQRLGKMSPDERAIFIKMLEDKKAADEVKKMNDVETGNFVPTANINTNNNWYFSNPSTVAAGFNSFRNKWGARKYEDNWRLSDKNITILDEENKTDEKEVENKTDQNTANEIDTKNKQKKTIDLSGIPDNEEKMAASNEAIENALYSLAGLYVDKLSNYKKSNETYIELLRRFPNTNKKPSILYAMAVNAQKSQNQEQYNQYRNELVNQFPTSPYVQLLDNPNSLLQLNADNAIVTAHYNTTYEQFKKEQYESVIARSNNIDSLYGNERELAAKLHLLRAISYGKTQGEDKYMYELQKLSNNYPETQAKNKAQEMLALIASRDKNWTPKPFKSIVETELEAERKQKELEKRLDNQIKSANTETNINASENKPAEKTLQFVYNAEKPHYVMIYFVDKTNNALNKYTNIVNNYNRNNYNKEGITARAVKQENAKETVIIQTFANRRDAAKYMQNLKANTLYKNIETKNYVFSITEDNYSILQDQFSIAQYIKFYNNNYK
jgi:tetratricopeptide (TPR) repeat protein